MWYSRSFSFKTFIRTHTNIFSRGSSESTLDERYLLLKADEILSKVNEFRSNNQ